MLIRAMLSRPIVWVMLAVLLLVSVVDALTAGSSPILVFLLYFTAGFPLEVWNGFLASPFDRRRAFAVLFGPLLLVWLLCLAITWAGREAHLDPTFLKHFGAPGEPVRLSREHVEWPLHRATERIPGWPKDWGLPSDLPQASGIVAGYLREVFSLDVSPAELRTLGSESADVSWARDVQAKYEPAVRAILHRRAATASLLILCISLLAGWSLFAARSNSRWTRWLGGVLPIAIFLGIFSASTVLWRAPELFFETSRFLLAGPAWVPLLLLVAAVGLVALWYRSFRRLEAGAPTAQSV